MSHCGNHPRQHDRDKLRALVDEATRHRCVAVLVDRPCSLLGHVLDELRVRDERQGTEHQRFQDVVNQAGNQ